MPKTTRHVLKAKEVRFDGAFQLGLRPSVSSPSGKRSGGSESAKIRIAENHPDYAIVEVICPCGKITYVRCDYSSAGAASAGIQPVQK
jgi:hypothetical protein